MTQRVSFTSTAAHTVEGELALPAGDGRGPGVVVLQEWWGVNDQIKSVADRFAAEGFVALVPDLYHGKVTADATEAGALMKGLDWPHAMQDIAGAVAYLRAHPRCTGAVAAMGFCMGGALAFATACAVPGLAAVVPFYGVPGPQDYGSKVTAPIQAHFASKDDWASPTLARDIQATLQAAGKPMELHIYEAEHAFFNEARPEVHDPAASALAWQRTLTFLRAHT